MNSSNVAFLPQKICTPCKIFARISCVPDLALAYCAALKSRAWCPPDPPGVRRETHSSHIRQNSEAAGVSHVLARPVVRARHVARRLSGQRAVWLRAARLEYAGNRKHPGWRWIDNSNQQRPEQGPDAPKGLRALCFSGCARGNRREQGTEGHHRDNAPGVGPREVNKIRRNCAGPNPVMTGHWNDL